MANIKALLSVQKIDALGVTVSDDMFVNIPEATTLTTLNTWAAATLPVLDAVTDSKITLATLKVVLTLPGGLKADPAATAEAERTGLFNFSQASVPYQNGVDISGIKASLIVDGKIDLSAGAVTDLVDAFTVAVNGVIPISKFLYTLTGLVDALVTFRKHRKAENRRSYEVAT